MAKKVELNKLSYFWLGLLATFTLIINYYLLLYTILGIQALLIGALSAVIIGVMVKNKSVSFIILTSISAFIFTNLVSLTLIIFKIGFSDGLIFKSTCLDVCIGEGILFYIIFFATFVVAASTLTTTFIGYRKTK